jgi:hypothetical protein
MHIRYQLNCSIQLMRGVAWGVFGWMHSIRIETSQPLLFLFSAGLGDGFHDDLYDFIAYYYFWWSLSSASERFGFVSAFMKDQGTEIL